MKCELFVNRKCVSVVGNNINLYDLSNLNWSLDILLKCTGHFSLQIIYLIIYVCTNFDWNLHKISTETSSWNVHLLNCLDPTQSVKEGELKELTKLEILYMLLSLKQKFKDQFPKERSIKYWMQQNNSVQMYFGYKFIQ